MSNRPPSGTRKDSHYARLRRQHRDLQAPAEPAEDGRVRLYGLHTVRAALDNRERVIHRLMATRNALQRLDVADAASLPFPAEIVDPKRIDAVVGADAVHQGVMIEAEPLQPKRLAELKAAPLILVLDQVTDPHNVGAIMRSAVAFGAGALEHIDHIEVPNLARALEDLHAIGFRTVGLDSDAPSDLAASLSGRNIALVLGAEGKGLRQKSRETVTALARLDLPGPIHSLNVSNAAAVALYAARRYLSDAPANE